MKKSFRDPHPHVIITKSADFPGLASSKKDSAPALATPLAASASPGWPGYMGIHVGVPISSRNSSHING